MVLANLKSNLIKVQHEICSIARTNCLIYFQCDFQRHKSIGRDVYAPLHFDTFSPWCWLSYIQISLRSDKKFTLDRFPMSNSLQMTTDYRNTEIDRHTGRQAEKINI